MQTWMRRVRGALGMGLVWAVVWGAAGFVARWVLGVDTDAPLGLVFGMFGLLAGVVFSIVLALSEQRHRFDQLSVPRVAVWGAIAGVLLAAAFVAVVSLGVGTLMALAPTLAMASALCAAGSLSLARRAETRLLPANRDIAAAAELANEAHVTLLDGRS